MEEILDLLPENVIFQLKRQKSPTHSLYCRCEGAERGFHVNLPIPTLHLQNQREAPSYPSDMPAHSVGDTLTGFKHHAQELCGEPALPLCQQET